MTQSFVRKANKRSKIKKKKQLSILIFLESGTRILYCIATALMIILAAWFVLASILGENDLIIAIMSGVILAVSLLVNIKWLSNPGVKFIVLAIVTAILYGLIYKMSDIFIDNNLNVYISRIVSGLCLFVSFVIEWIKVGREINNEEKKIIEKYKTERKNIK